jgi:hypothetical protein
MAEGTVKPGGARTMATRSLVRIPATPIGFIFLEPIWKWFWTESRTWLYSSDRKTSRLACMEKLSVEPNRLRLLQLTHYNRPRHERLPLRTARLAPDDGGSGNARTQGHRVHTH